MHTSAMMKPSPYPGCACEPIEPTPLICAEQFVMLKTDATPWLTRLSVWQNVQPLQAQVPSAAMVMQAFTVSLVVV